MNKPLSGRAWFLGCALTLVIALLATVPTTGDIGLTWDEPSYRTSQIVSGQWWEGLAKAAKAGSRADFDALVTPEALLYYWPYARFGYNFHPPLAGQLNLFTHATFGHWMKDIPSRRMASVLEYVATIVLAFGFLARRYGPWVGSIASGSLLLMPRVYGDGHIAGTDTPGLFLWALTALAFWKGLHEPNARKWRILVGVALGLGFVEKMAALAILGPILAWLVLARLPNTLFRKGFWGNWIDGIGTLVLMLIPLGLAFREVRRLADLFPEAARTDLFTMHPLTSMTGVVLLIPMVVWIVRRLLALIFRKSPIWGVERPGLETLSAILAFAPVVAWLGNPAWWRETLPRMAHYYQLSADRRGALPDIRILYLGEIYNYSLPWHNAWVLIAITVPAGILLASGVGLFTSMVRGVRMRDALPLYFLLNLVFLPVLRMLPTPAHDGIRLFLPTFFFLAGFAGWGAVAVANALTRWVKHPRVCRSLVAILILGSASWQLIKIHPFELSYYNEFIGGPRGAWKAGFELSYWYDAFNHCTLNDLNEKIPDGASVDFFNDLINTPTFGCLQELGELKSTINLGSSEQGAIPYGWILTHDSKAVPFTRLLFAMTPVYQRDPRQLDNLRVVTLDAPEAVTRAWALDILTHVFTSSETLRAPEWVRRSTLLKPFGRFWGEGINKGPTLAVNHLILDWARSDPDSLRAAARVFAERRKVEPGSPASKLQAIIDRQVTPDLQVQARWRSNWVDPLLRTHPEALLEAVEILVARPDAVRSVLLHPAYTDVDSIGGYLDASLKGPVR